MKSLTIAGLAACTLAAAACGSGKSASSWWSEAEIAAIEGQGQVMKVLTIDSVEDSLVLRTPCSDFSAEELASSTYAVLAEKMVSTVTSPEQDGVGIAGPQVGLSRRVVAVMRYDKEDRPFEVFPNVRIIAKRGEMLPGPEGCLSVPGRRGSVLRYRDIDIQYTSPRTLRDTVETIKDYTAVIFQHECDHLDGVLYIDKLEPAE